MKGLKTSIIVLHFLCTFYKIYSQSSYEKLTATPVDRNVFNDVSIGFGYYEGSHYHKSPPDPGRSGISTTGAYPISFGFGPPNLIAVPPKHARLYAHRSSGVGINFTQTRTYGEYDKLIFKVDYASGLNRELDTLPYTNVSFYDFHSSVQYDTRWFGTSLGLHYGHNYQEKAYIMVYYTNYNQVTNYFAPSTSIRILPYDLFYVKATYNDYFPFVLGARSKLSYRLSAGTGLGRKNGTCIEAGFDRVGGPFCTVKWMTTHNFGWEVHAFFPFNDEYTNNLFTGSIVFRLNSKHWEKKYF